MAGQTKPRALRPLGPWELYSSTRHSLGIYRAVVVTVRYDVPPDVKEPNAVFLAALALVVEEQPFLQVGILDQDTTNASFSYLQEIDLRNHYEWRVIQVDSRENYEKQVDETQAWLHDQMWPEIETRAPWRAIVLQPSSTEVLQKPVIDILFAFHHSIADGTGGRVFHECLGAALDAQTENAGQVAAGHKLYFPDAPELPEPLEEVIAFKNSYSFISRTIWDMAGPSFLKSTKPPTWAGKRIDFSLPYVTRIHSISFSHDTIQSLSKAARDHSSSVTGALHALVLASLARRVGAEEAVSFESTTPINLRPWISPGIGNPHLRTKMRSLVTAYETLHSQDVVNRLRSTPVATDELIWQTAKRVKYLLKQRASKIPADDQVGLLRFIPNLFDFWRGKDGKERAHAWEVSNIGIMGGNGSTTKWKPTRPIFTNGAVVAGAAIGINVMTVAGEAFTISISWQEGVVDGSIVQGLAQDLQDYIERLHETGSFSNSPLVRS